MLTEALLRALIAAIEAEIASLPTDTDSATEAGRIFSAANETQLRAAVQALNNLLAQVSLPPDPAQPGQQQPQQPPAPPASGRGAPPAFVQQAGGQEPEAWAVESAESTVMAVSESLATKGKGLARIITPGWGSSGYYSPAVLERDAPTAFPAGTKMFWDHPAKDDGRPERSLRDLAAETTEPARYMAAGPEGPGVYAKVKVFSDYQPKVDELKEHIGLSIRSSAAIKPGEAEGRKGAIVERLIGHPTNSVDFVTIPGRGGRITALFEAARGSNTTQEDDVSAEELKAAQEAQAKAERERDAAYAKIATQEATNVAAGIIAKVDMPQAARIKVLAEVLRDVPVKDGALDKPTFEAAVQKAADAEKAYLDQITGRGRVTGMGSGASEGASGSGGEAVTEAEMTAAFERIGLSEGAAKIAGAGRRN